MQQNLEEIEKQAKTQLKNIQSTKSVDYIEPVSPKTKVKLGKLRLTIEKLFQQLSNLCIKLLVTCKAESKDFLLVSNEILKLIPEIASSISDFTQAGQLVFKEYQQLISSVFEDLLLVAGSLKDAKTKYERHSKLETAMQVGIITKAPEKVQNMPESIIQVAFMLISAELRIVSDATAELQEFIDNGCILEDTDEKTDEKEATKVLVFSKRTRLLLDKISQVLATFQLDHTTYSELSSFISELVGKIRDISRLNDDFVFNILTGDTIESDSEYKNLIQSIAKIAKNTVDLDSSEFMAKNQKWFNFLIKQL